MLDTTIPASNTILDSIDTVVWSGSLDPFAIDDVGRGAERLYGHASAAFRADPRLWLQVVHPEDRPRVAARQDALRSTGTSATEYRIVRPDGSLRWVLDRAWLVRDPTSGLERVHGIAIDVTAHLQADQELVAWTRRLEAVHAVAVEITRERDLTALLDLVIERAVALTGAVRGTVWLWDESRQGLVPKACHGVPGLDDTIRLRLGEGVVGRAALQRQSIHALGSDARIGYVGERILAPKANAVLAEPIVFQDRLIGVITNILVDPDQTFSEHDQQVLRVFAAQVAVAIENARLYARQEQRLARQETLTRLNHLVSASLDLPVVLQEIAQAASTLMSAPRVSFWLVDESHRRLELRAYTDPSMPLDLPRTVLSFDEGLVGWVATHRETERVPDVSVDERTFAPEDLCRRGLQSLLAMPIQHDGAVLAVLALARTHPFAPEPDDDALLASFGAQAAAAIRNARLYAAEAQARAAAEAAQERYRALVDGIGAIVWEVDPQGRCTYVNQAAEALLGYPVARWLATTDFGALFADPADLALLLDSLETARTEGQEHDLHLRARTAGGRELWLRALIWPVRDGGAPPWPLRGLFIDITERRRATEEATRLRAAVERLEERQRIAMDLHDGATQALYGAELQLAALCRRETSEATRDALRQARAQVQRAIHDVRKEIADLRSSELDGRGLHERLVQLGEELCTTTGLRLTLALDPRADSALPASAAPHLLYLVREATSNVIRHAAASTVRITLERTDSSVVLSIADDGRGFEPSALRDGAGHGLRNMKARAMLVDGQLAVRSAPGRGTTVRVELPARP